MAALPTIPDGPQIVFLGASSDLSTFSGHIVYKNRTSPTHQYALGETTFANHHWGISRVIELDQGLIMPEHLALSHDPIDTQGRALFFGQPYGDHQDVYIKRFDVSLRRWSKAVKIKDTQTGDVITAHRRSKFAATMGDGKFFVYFVNCGGDLVEWVSELMPAVYGWRQSGVVANGILPESYLGAVRRNNRSIVLFKHASGELSVANPHGDQWHLTTVPNAGNIPKGAPLAISDSGRGGLTVYFSDSLTIFSQVLYKNTTIMPLQSALEKVGRHAPFTNFGVIYFPRGGPDDPTNNAHLLSVSILDGHRMLVERIRRSRLWPEAGDVRWLLSGGVIDVDDPFR